MNYIKIFLFCAILSINGCHIYVRSVESICEHIRYKDIDSVEVFSCMQSVYFDTVKVIDRTKRYPLPIGTVNREYNSVDIQKFILKRDFVTKYVRDNLYELTDSLLKNYRRSAYSEKQISTFPHDSSLIYFQVYFSNTCLLQVSLWNYFYYSYGEIRDASVIYASKDNRNILESIPYLNPIRGSTHYTRDYWTKTSLYKDIINETFNELAVYYNSIESDSSKHVKLLAKPIPIPIK